MIKYLFKRLLLLIPVLLGVSLAVFVVMHVFVPDPTYIILGQHATAERAAALRAELGLNDPLYIQYGNFLMKAVQGDLGRSLMTRTPVLKEILSRFPATIELAMAAMALATVAGVVVGIISAVKQYSLFDYISMTGALMGVSMPIFWLGLLLIVIFSVEMKGFLPATGLVGIGLEPDKVTGFMLLDSVLTGNRAAFTSSLRHLVLPAVALGAYSTALIARMTRSTMLEIIRQDYIRTARAKGLAERVVVYKHALKNALIPVITVIGLQTGSLLGGAVLTETVFSRPGLGSLVVSAIQTNDYPLMQGAVLFIATVYVMVNLVVDITYAFIDPRIRYS